MLKKIVTLAMAAVLAVSLVACGNTASKPTATPQPVDLAAFGEKYVTEEKMPALLDTQEDMGKQIMDANYAGLNDIDTKQCLLYVSLMGVNSSEMALVQVTNSEDVSKVKDVFQARIDGMINGGAFYPSDVENWTNNSEIVTNGDYVALVVSTDKDAIVEAFNALFA